MVTVLILLALFEKFFHKSVHVYRWAILGAFIPALFDFCKTLPEGIQTALNIPAMTAFGAAVFPFFDHGMGWIVPSLIGLLIGLAETKMREGKDAE